MDKEMKESAKGHVLLVPFPAQGHTNPILQFAKRLASKGLKTTLATTVFISKTMHLKDCKVGIETISDGFDEIGPSAAETAEHYLSNLKQEGSRTLADIIDKHNYGNSSDTERITCLICDSILPWGLEVGKQFGLMTAAFYTQTCAVSSIYYHVKQGNLSVPVEEPTVSLPGLPLLALQDMPSSVRNFDQSLMDLLTGQFTHIEKADWLLFNTFDDLESEVLKRMAELGRVRTIGPTTPSMYLDKRVEGDTENSLNLFEPSDGTYIDWLNAKEAGSVLYVSFGSISELAEEQMQELIWGIRQSNKDFIWVVREKEQSKLSPNFLEEVIDKGLVVQWCSQLEVLSHKAIGCFLTHCGWNSTLEALSLGVPMVAMPQLWDQATNAKFVEDVWEVGIRVKVDDKGIVTRDQLESCIRDVMDGERGKIMRMKTSQWRELAKDAVDAGGSSDSNIQEFVASLTCR